MLTISGLAALTESDNPYVFRFLPNDREIKVAHARYVVDKLKKTKPALIGDTTAYGQGGFDLLQENFTKLGAPPVFGEMVAPDIKDMTPILTKIKESGADVIVVHTIAPPMALLVKQARAIGIDLPIVTGSSLVEPTATALFDPAELKDVCAETPSAPESRATPEMKEWADAYMARFGLEPDGLALGQYDAVMMAMSIIAKGANTPADVAKALQETTYKGVAMTYKSNGKGDMAHDADIVCWDGTSRIPRSWRITPAANSSSNKGARHESVLRPAPLQRRRPRRRLRSGGAGLRPRRQCHLGGEFCAWRSGDGGRLRRRGSRRAGYLFRSSSFFRSSP